MASIRCEHGHTHDSIAAVRACVGITSRSVPSTATPQGGGVAVLTRREEGALKRLERATVPVQAQKWPTEPQVAALTKLMSKKSPTKEQATKFLDMWDKCRTNADVQRMFDLIRSLPWKDSSPPPSSQAKSAFPKVEKDARYAVVEDGKARLFKIKTTKTGFQYLDVKSSDSWFPIMNGARKAAIINAINEDPEAAGLLYAELDRSCRRCGRELSDVDNPYFDMGLGPDCGRKW